jgi:AcrR family transcriptional regulator
MRKLSNKRPVPARGRESSPSVDRAQRRRESTEALLEIGRHLIEQGGVDQCSMNDVAAAAGCSIGSIYFRFGNKERFVNEVMRRQIDATRELIARFLVELEGNATSPSEVIEATTQWLVLEYSKNQGLLRAQIRRSFDNRQKWQPFQEIARELVHGAIRILERFPKLRQDNSWQTGVRIAMQMILGTLNNAVINQPGPLELTDKAMSRELSKAAIRYLCWDDLRETKLPRKSGLKF